MRRGGNENRFEGSEFLDDSSGLSGRYDAGNRGRDDGLGSFGYRTGDDNDRNYQGMSSRNRAGERGLHAGKGPKGYTRSDARVHEDVCEALCRHDEIDASDIEVIVSNGEVTLSGTVSERYLKRVAEDCVENVLGVRDIINTIRVGSAKEPMEKRGIVPKGKTH